MTYGFVARRLRVRGAGGEERAELLIYGDIGGDPFFDGVSAKHFAEQLRALGPVSQIDVRINSYGGDIFDGFAIYNQLRTHNARKTVFVDGIAASAASVIAMAGHDIRIAEAGFMMIHDPWGMTMGGADHLREFADRLDVMAGSVAGLYAVRTQRSVSELRDWMRKETWFNAADAVKYGFATEIVEHERMAASGRPFSLPLLDRDRYRFKRAPAALSARPGYDAAKAKLAEQRRRLSAAVMTKAACGGDGGPDALRARFEEQLAKTRRRLISEGRPLPAWLQQRR